jgi:hypothetical protein
VTVIIGPLASESATVVGFLAGLIAVCGFIAHSGPVLAGGSEKRVRQATVIGGLGGLAAGLLVVVLSAILRLVSS